MKHLNVTGFRNELHLHAKENTGTTAKELMKLLTKVFDITMPRRQSRRHRSLYWWTQNIAEARKACIERREHQRRAQMKLIQDKKRKHNQNEAKDNHSKMIEDNNDPVYVLSEKSPAILLGKRLPSDCCEKAENHSAMTREVLEKIINYA
ncbi:unnamed protein product [Acanthoscelides obtectus]|uniref:Uncharacterized protein n=1 Tax=Acanthoscelides obtectus TaxID=200917 RepID=A0A9P0LA14_ACAOB|nr:unnamed protein product [Acanthoscelides obtectus]CAK1624876.1 hypothetical protein AOBTE_LOCUS2815 [Acanthoscelides obtectus]